MAVDKWERAKERFTDWFDYGYNRTIKRSPDAKTTYQERIESRQRCWEEQETAKNRRQFDSTQVRETDIHDDLDEKSSLGPPPSAPEKPKIKGSSVRVYIPTGSPLQSGSRTHYQGRPHVFFAYPSPPRARRRPEALKTSRPRGYFTRPAAGHRRRYQVRLGTLFELDEEEDRGRDAAFQEKALDVSDSDSGFECLPEADLAVESRKTETVQSKSPCYGTSGTPRTVVGTKQ